MKKTKSKTILLIAAVTILSLIAAYGCSDKTGQQGGTTPAGNSGATATAGGSTPGTSTSEPTATTAPTTSAPATPTPLVLSETPEGYDANDKAPAPDILDLVFENGKAKNAAEGGNEITDLNDPAVKKDPIIDKDAAEFSGGEEGEDTMYAMYDFGKYKDTLSDGFTFEVYVRVLDDSIYGVILGYMQAGGAGIDYDPTNSSNEWNTGANSSIGFGVRDEGRDAYVFLYREESIETDRYYHVVGTFDGKTVCLYYDGVLIKSAELQGALSHPAIDNPYVGIGGDLSSGNVGEDAIETRLAVARIYSVPLTASQVYNRYLEVVNG